jgi:cellulase (glycosyl hydrolase family 5)
MGIEDSFSFNERKAVAAHVRILPFPVSSLPLVVAAVAVMFVASLVAPTVDAAPVPVPWLKTVGNRIVTANTDQEVTLRGVNVLRSEWEPDLEMGFERAGIPVMAGQWKGNVVLRGFASDPVNSGDSEYLDVLDEHVSLAEANHLYMIFAWRSHEIHGDQPRMPDDSAQQAMAALAQRYRDKPNVMYALQVEPHDVTWNQLQPRYVRMVDAIRTASAPYKPIIMLPGTDWSRDVSGAITNPVARENVVYKTHPYNSQSQFQHQFVDTHDAGFPVFIGEFGYLPEGGMSMSDVNALLTVARQHNLGWAAWILDDGTGNTALVTNGSTFAPTAPYGTTIKNEMTTTPPLPTDEGPPQASVNDTTFQYTGTWHATSGTAKFQGDDRYADVAGDTYSVSFTGSQVRLYAATAPWHGKAAISVDGTTETTVDFYSPTRVDQAPVYSSPPLASGQHTVRVRVTGSKNASSTGTVVTADRADIVSSPASTINDNTIGTGPNQFQYTGSWSYTTGSSGKFQGDDHFSATAGATARITVTGTRIALYGSKAPWHGMASLSIDNAPAVTVDYYATARQDNVVVYTSPSLTAGSHSVAVTATGTRNPAATDAVVTVDRVVVNG